MYLDMNNGKFSWFYLMLTTLLIARLAMCKLTHKVGTVPVTKVHRSYID